VTLGVSRDPQFNVSDKVRQRHISVNDRTLIADYSLVKTVSTPV
jgi:hypothetical protein